MANSGNSFHDYQNKFWELKSPPAYELEAIRLEQTGQWKLQGAAKHVIDEFKSIAKKAIHLLNFPSQMNSTNAWLGLLWAQTEHQRSGDGKAIIPNVLEVSANYSHWLEHNGSTGQTLPFHKHIHKILQNRDLILEEIAACYSWLMFPPLANINEANYKRVRVFAEDEQHCKSEDMDFCVMCLLVISCKKPKKPSYNLWIDRLDSTLVDLRKIEKKHGGLMRQVSDNKIAINPAISIGTNSSLLTKYIHEVESLAQHLKDKSKMKEGDPRDEALLYLVDRLKRDGRIARGVWTKVAQILQLNGRAISSNSLRISYEALKQKKAAAE